MTRGPEPPSAADAELASQLREATPRPGVALKRRVRHRIGAAFERESLRRRAAILVAAGGAFLVSAVVLALSGPS
jgi:hypothetical protein